MRAFRFLVAVVLAASVGGLAWRLGAHGHPFVLPLDDAYIYLQYAQTAASGHWGSYVAGAPASTGATSLAWLIGLVKAAYVSRIVHAPLETALPFAALLGCTLSLAISFWLVMRLGARHGVPALFTALPCLIALLSPLWMFGAMNGMETGFYAMALLAGAWVLAGGGFLWLLPLALARPEGAVLALAILAWRMIRGGASYRSRPWILLAVTVAAGLSLLWPWLLTGQPAAAWEAKALWQEPKAEVRLFYLPRLPYFAGRCLWFGLSGARSQPPLGLAEAYFRASAWPVWATALFLGTGALLTFIRRRGRGLIALWILASLPALISVAWDAQFYRYLVPAYPLLITGAVVGWFGGTFARKRFGVAGALLALLVLGAFAAPSGLGTTMRRLYRGECERMESTQLRVGHWIADNLSPDARIATHDVGAIAFASGRPVVDLVGLVTPALAGAYRHGEGALWEALEALPPESRPTHMAVIPAWMPYLYRTDVFNTKLFGLESARSERSPIGQAFEVWSLSWPSDDRDRFPTADFDDVPYAYGPASDQPDWNIVDELDIAYLVSERAHRYRDEHGTGVTVVRELGFGIQSEAGQPAAIEGGRDVNGNARFVMHAHPGSQALLLLRATTVERPELVVRIGAWSGIIRMVRNEHVFQEAAALIPSEAVRETMEVTVEGRGYRAFHWWLLQRSYEDDDLP
jgi:hypothetical protein